MSPSGDVILGLAAALGFGSADFLARQVTHRIGFLSTLYLLQALGSLGLLPLAAFYERSLWQAGDPWLLILALGVLNLMASLALYRAFEYGALSVVTPLVSMAPAVTTVLALLILGERPGAAALAGIVLVLVGIATMSRTAVVVSGPVPKDARAGLASAFVALAGFGVLAFSLKFVIGPIGPITTIVTLRLVGVVIVLAGAWTNVTRIVSPPRNVWPLIIAFTTIDTAAFVAYATGIQVGSVAIVSTLSGLFSLVTITLAALVLRERLRPISYLSIGVALTGIVFIAGR